MQALRDRVEEAKSQLVNSNDPDWDRMVKGMVRAYHEMLNVRVDSDQTLVDIEESE